MASEQGERGKGADPERSRTVSRSGRSQKEAGCAPDGCYWRIHVAAAIQPSPYPLCLNTSTTTAREDGSTRRAHAPIQSRHVPARPPFPPWLAAARAHLLPSRLSTLDLAAAARRWTIGPMRARSKCSWWDDQYSIRGKRHLFEVDGGKKRGGAEAPEEASPSKQQGQTQKREGQTQTVSVIKPNPSQPTGWQFYNSG